MTQTTILGRHRSRILTNSAAEFVETRSEQVLGLELSQRPPEFVPELDSFVAPDDLELPDYYQEAQQKLVQFRETLAAFQSTLSRGKFSEHYNITLKDAYTIEDVIGIAEKVQKQHQAAGEVNTCMGKIRRFFRASGEHAPTLQQFLEFVPSGDYTSPICGGFTVILSSLERMEKVRLDMYKALAEVPKIMSRIARQRRVHYESPRLKHKADMVWVAIFTVLEAIIRELSTSCGKKIGKSLLKGQSYASYVDDAIAELDARVSEFESEANLCDSERLGQIAVTVNKTNSSMQDLIDNANSNFEKLRAQFAADKEERARFDAKMELFLQQNQDTIANQRAQDEQLGVYNSLYRFLAASSTFDSKAGIIDKGLQVNGNTLRPSTPVCMYGLPTAMSLLAASPSPSVFGSSPLQWSPLQRPNNEAAAKEWLKAARRPHHTAQEDLRSCIAGITSKTNIKEQDQVGHILASGELRAWLRAPNAQLLGIKLSSGYQPYLTPASYAAAVLVQSLRKSTTSPVLSHMCACRERDPYNDSLGGGKGMLISLVAQLIATLRKQDKRRQKTNGPCLDLTFLRYDVKSDFENVSGSVNRLLSLLRRLLQLLPPNSGTVFAVLDSIWKLQTPGDKDARRAVRGLLKIAIDSFKASKGDSGHFVLKLAVTEPLSIEQMYDDIFLEGKGNMSRQRIPEGFFSSLHVPTNVPGRVQTGINPSWVEEEVEAMIQECSGRDSSSQSEASSYESDSESSDESDRRKTRHRSGSHKKSRARTDEGRSGHSSGCRSRSYLNESESSTSE